MMLMTIIAIASLAFTSCEDARIARTLEGTWKGNMYISSRYDGRVYNSTYSEVTFLKDPGAYSSGSGYWVDYYSDAPWDYITMVPLRFALSRKTPGFASPTIIWTTTASTACSMTTDAESTSNSITPRRLIGTAIVGATTLGTAITLQLADPLHPIPQLRKSPSASYARQMPRPPLNDTSTALD